MELRVDPLQSQIADAMDAALTHTGDLHLELAAAGVPRLGAPESLGGMGLGLGADIMVNLRLGYGMSPLGAVRETALALDLLADHDVPQHVLDAVFDGGGHATSVGMHEHTTLRVDDDDLVWGDSERLPKGSFRIAALRAVTPAGDTRWYVVLPDGDTCHATYSEQLDLPTARLHFAGAPATPLSLDETLVGRARDAARVRQSAVLLGIADRAIDQARSHVNRRVQYGKPLVERQTVAHGLARLVGLGDGWRLMLHETAWLCDTGEDCRARAARVLAVAAEHALAATRQALQLHGARGMLAQSAAARAYRIASIEAGRMGPPASLWAAAAAREPRSAAGEAAAQDVLQPLRSGEERVVRP